MITFRKNGEIMSDLPFIQKMSDGKYHLFCGVCHGSNPYVHEVGTTLMPLYSIACGNHCGTSGGDNEICGISDIPKIAKRDCGNEEKRVVNDICETLGLNLFYEYGS